MDCLEKIFVRYRFKTKGTMRRALMKFSLFLVVWICGGCRDVSGTSLGDGHFLMSIHTNAWRGLSKCIFPKMIRLNMTSFPGSELNISIRLIRHHQDRHVPIYTVASHRLIKVPSVHVKQRHGFYFSEENDAHLQVTCISTKNNKQTFTVTGSIVVNSQEYVVSSFEDLSNTLLPVLLESWGDGRVFVQFRKLVHTQRGHDYTISENSVVIDTADKPSVDIQISRLRRDINNPVSVTSFTVDVVAVVDYSVFKTWNTARHGSEGSTVHRIRDEIRHYYGHVIKGVDLRYKNIGYSEWQINIVLSGVVIIESAEACPWILDSQEYVVDADMNADVALTAFKLWVNDTEGLPVHDHAILLTKYDLYTSNKLEPSSNRKMSHTSGLAFIGTLCEPEDSVSIVEEQGGFQSVGTVAHEIGHSLGALHDGENNTCMSENRYIMAASGFGPVPETKKYNPWVFSECSVDYFRHFIAKQLTDGSSCLLGTTNQSNKRTLLPGQLYNPDEQCKMIWGPNSYLCRGAEFGNASTLCTSMYCRDPSTVSDCVLHTAARGTSCGDQQWCNQGKCVYSTDAPTKRGACILGDQPGPAFNGMTCAELVSVSPSYCYQDKVRARCCESCGAQQTWRKGCEYGDRIQGCRDVHCTMVDANRDIQNECCATCRNGELMTTTSALPRDVVTVPVDYAHTHDACEDHDVTSGDSCEQLIESRGRYVCYDDAILNRCCRSCSRISDDTLKDCAYGDRTPDLCSRIANRTELVCSRFRSHCCESCVHTIHVFNGTTSLHDAAYRIMTAIGICFTVVKWMSCGS